MSKLPALEPGESYWENHYACTNCQTKWQDKWSCQCDDRCPMCNRSMMAHTSHLIGSYRIFDNGGETFDRYTVVFTDSFNNVVHARGMSEQPTYPNGFGQCVEIGQEWLDADKPDKEISYTDLTDSCKQVIDNDLDILGL